MQTKPGFNKRQEAKARQDKIRPEIEDGIEHESVVTIMAGAEKIYNYWRDLKNLPTFMKHLTAIEVKNSKLSHWKWNALLGNVHLEWDSEIIEDKKNELITWRSKEGAEVAHTGEVSFHELENGRGTEVRVLLNYHPPGGVVTDFLEKILGESPQRTLQDDLRRLRELMETGKIPTVEGQPRGGLEPTINPNLHRNRQERK